jgi:hypothetical protein
VLPALRETRAGEQRTSGTLLSVECGRSGIVIEMAVGQDVVRARASSFAAVDFVTYRATTAGTISCGAQPAEPALLTWRPVAEGLPVAVALELLPDGFVP